MAFVAPTTKDISRSVARLDENASVPVDSVIDIDGMPWSLFDLRVNVARNLAFTVKNAVNIFKVSKRDVSLMLAAHGATPFTIERHAFAIARIMRGDFANHTWSGTL